MSILFNWRDSIQVNPIPFNICQINSQFSQRCLFHPSQVVFVFLALPPFFLKDSDFLINYPFIDGKSLHSFRQCSYPVIRRKILRKPQVRHSSFFFFYDGFNSSFVDHILSSFKMFSHAGAPLNLSFLAIHLSWSAKDILEDLCFHS